MSASTTAAERCRLLVGDALALLPSLPARSVDAVVTDPPYGIGFRDEPWDTPARSCDQSAAQAFEAWTGRWATECLRVLKPGGHLVAFGAPRTAHRLAAGIEDAGFELRDQLVWLYGTGVPKGRLVDGRSSTLKPAYEPILLARTPLADTHDATEERWGTGRLGIDESRIPGPDTRQGRWPCNVTLSHTGRCRPRRCTSGCVVASLDRSRPDAQPSRFFYCAKPSLRERDAGCDRLPARPLAIYKGSGGSPRRNTHPTVKPVELMRWLIRLACPPGGLVVDPFAGSGTTGIAALAEGRRFLGIERETDYAEIARARLSAQAEAA